LRTLLGQLNPENRMHKGKGSCSMKPTKKKVVKKKTPKKKGARSYGY